MAYALKGTRPGYDVSSVVDYLFAFNAAWPLLKIEAAGAATINLNGTPQTVYTHNLGYRPFYLIISNQTAGKGLVDIVSGGGVGLGVSTTILGYDGSNSGGGTYSFYYYICRLDLTQNFTAPTVTGSTTKGTQNDRYVFKVTKPGKSTNSTDMRDYAFHSNTRSPMLHSVDYGFADVLSGGYATRTVTHNLGYTPIAFCFIKWTNNNIGHNNDWAYLQAPPIGAQPDSYVVSSTNVVSSTDLGFTVLTVPNISTVILKDPFQKDTVNVSFP